MELVDLHTHTTASDGTDSPAELVRKAATLGLAAVAITDHDTVSGLAVAGEIGRDLGIAVVRGCELSSATEYGEVHLLGLWLPREVKPLQRCFAYLRRNRCQRNKRIVGKLRDLGFNITIDEVREKAGGDTVGRPHIAAVLVEKGYAPDIGAAFSEYLGYGGKAYLPRKVLAPATAVRLLSHVGATVVIAHPMLHHFPQEWLKNLIRELKGSGLDGLEVWHSGHSQADTATCLGWVRELNMLPSGGSDYHGENKPGICLGTGYGNLRVTRDVYENLLANRRSRGLPV